MKRYLFIQAACLFVSLDVGAQKVPVMETGGQPMPDEWIDRWNTGGSDNYWSCNVRGAGSNWCYVGKKTALADRYKGVACNGNAYIRFLFAF